MAKFKITKQPDKQSGEQPGTSIVQWGETDGSAIDELSEQLKHERGGAVWKPHEGMNTIRVLPPLAAMRTPYRVTYAHNIDVPGVGNVFFVCPRMEAKAPCPACTFGAQLTQSKARQDQDRAKSFNPRRLVHTRIVDRENEDQGVQVYRFGVMVHDGMRKLWDNPKWGDFAHPTSGYDLTVIQTKEANGIKYTVQPTPRCPLSDDAAQMLAWHEQACAIDLERFVRVLTPDEIAAKMRGDRVAAQAKPASRRAWDELHDE